MTTAEKNDDCIESNEQLDKCVKFDVREDSTVGVKIAELLMLNVSTSIDEQFSLKVQKTAEVSRTQFIDRMVNIPVVQQRQEVVQKIVEMHRFSTNGANGSEDRGGYTSAVLDKGCRHVRCGAKTKCPWFRWCRKPVGHEESQSACMIATGGVAAYQLTSTAWNSSSAPLQFECGSTVEPGDNSTRAAAER